MKLTKMLLFGATALSLLTSCNGSSDDPKYEVTAARTILVATTDGTDTRTSLSTANIGLDLYDTSSGSFVLNNFLKPNGSYASLNANLLTYSANAVGYSFKQALTSTLTGLIGATYDFNLYMGGISQINTRVSIDNSEFTLLGYGNVMYLFSTATINSDDGLSTLTTTEATTNVIQVYLANGDVDGTYTATLYWTNPAFDKGITEDRNLGIAGLSVSIDPYAGALTVSSGDKSITPCVFEDGSSTLTTEVSNYKVRNLTLTVGSFANNSVYLNFDLDYTPTASESVIPTTTTYHFSASLREAASLS
jgi:hypothetical protein